MTILKILKFPPLPWICSALQSLKSAESWRKFCIVSRQKIGLLLIIVETNFSKFQHYELFSKYIPNKITTFDDQDHSWMKKSIEKEIMVKKHPWKSFNVNNRHYNGYLKITTISKDLSENILKRKKYYHPQFHIYICIYNLYILKTLSMKRELH